MSNLIRLAAVQMMLVTLCLQACTQQEPASVNVAPAEPVPVVSTPQVAVGRAATLAAALGKPKQLLIGLGTVNTASVQSQALKIDIYDQYINGVGNDSWINWNSPAGAYVGVVAKNADTLGAVPMFTLYQMAALGDGNLTGLSDPEFMRQYWNNVRILYRELKAYAKPALVNFEPDFWGYAQRQSSNPVNHFVHVNTQNPDCADQPNNMTGLGNCLVNMARSLAPKAYVGFPPSTFPDLAATEANYMKLVGAGRADFAVIQTADRDSGCFEAKYTADGAGCDRANGLAYTWDASNRTLPNFTSHFAQARLYFESIQLPLIWWQTPMGVLSTTAGGTPGNFRDNKLDYFLTHTAELVAAGGVGVVFSPGHTSQTNLNTDRGQFKRLSEPYFRNPAALP